MGTRSNIIVHRADGKWHAIYCHYDGYLSHNGRILFDHYTDQKHVDALVSGGDMSILGENCTTKPRGHSFDKRKEGYCVYYIRDRGMGPWHFAKTKAEFLASEQGKIGDTLQAVWPEEDSWTEFVYVWEGGKWWVGDAREGTQALVDLGDALSGKATCQPMVQAFGMVIGRHAAHDPSEPDKHTWHTPK